ncbi:tryptophan tryptophylquinone biosynthesis enzyme MauG [Parashewanella curva]|uniref:Methylamine utilization protein MauG n=1 Tax=Parashewanella curva TaxID=2338552 RepID=A0A3L8PYZ0_9GAMM|nr:cytochrome c peroxidase [Parashewanella curva]RLV60594.1 tryptophan tryptophylquinone biosynthesis enzyme MauG [Parashewanella curva]
MKARIFLLLGALFISGQSLAKPSDAFKRPDHIPFPASNPYSAPKAALGKMLFFDPRLSRNRNLTCASCHNPSFGWEDATARAVGSQNTQLGRHSPSIINAAWGASFFWDGRAKDLEAQARGPIEAAVEMNITLPEVVARLKKVQGYRTLFGEVFGSSGINEQNILKAIATFERTIVSGEAPFDRWVEGDNNAINSEAKRGFELFIGKARCASCHSGWNFTDNEFHDIGVDAIDEGRFVITKNPIHKFAFKTPSLRNISQRAPYMHDGSMNDLNVVIRHYMKQTPSRPSLSPLMQPVQLSEQEIDQLVAFLKTLTGEDKVITLPLLPY